MMALDASADRRALLVAMGHDGDVVEMILSAERHAAEKLKTEAPGPPVEAVDADAFDREARRQKQARRKSTPAILAEPERTRHLTDAEWALLAPHVPDDVRATLKPRDYVDTLIKVVAGGQSWLGAQGAGPGGTAVRERRRRERSSPTRMLAWAEVEAIVRAEFSEPMKSWMLRVARFVRGDLSVRARRPTRQRRPHKFGASGPAVPAKPDC